MRSPRTSRVHASCARHCRHVRGTSAAVHCHNASGVDWFVYTEDAAGLLVRLAPFGIALFFDAIDFGDPSPWVHLDRPSMILLEVSYERPAGVNGRLATVALNRRRRLKRALPSR